MIFTHETESSKLMFDVSTVTFIESEWAMGSYANMHRTDVSEDAYDVTIFFVSLKRVDIRLNKKQLDSLVKDWKQAMEAQAD